MFAICEVREFAGSFSKLKESASAASAGDCSAVALLFALGAGGQVVRVAEGDVSPTPHPSEPPVILR